MTLNLVEPKRRPKRKAIARTCPKCNKTFKNLSADFKRVHRTLNNLPLLNQHQESTQSIKTIFLDSLRSTFRTAAESTTSRNLINTHKFPCLERTWRSVFELLGSSACRITITLLHRKIIMKFIKMESLNLVMGCTNWHIVTKATNARHFVQTTEFVNLSGRLSEGRTM